MIEPMPLKLVLVFLAVAAIVARSVFEAYVDIPDPIDLTIIGVGLGMLVGLLFRRQWVRPLGLTYAGVLLFLGFFGFMFAFSAGHRIPLSYADPVVVAVTAARFVTGLVVLWCMRHRDTVRWLAESAARGVA